MDNCSQLVCFEKFFQPPCRDSLSPQQVIVVVNGTDLCKTFTSDGLLHDIAGDAGSRPVTTN